MALPALLGCQHLCLTPPKKSSNPQSGKEAQSKSTQDGPCHILPHPSDPSASGFHSRHLKVSRCQKGVAECGAEHPPWAWLWGAVKLGEGLIEAAKLNRLVIWCHLICLVYASGIRYVRIKLTYVKHDATWIHLGEIMSKLWVKPLWQVHLLLDHPHRPADKAHGFGLAMLWML